jgi:hypothetical protein
MATAGEDRVQLEEQVTGTAAAAVAVAASRNVRRESS